MSKRTLSASILKLATVNASILLVGFVVIELIFGSWIHAGKLDRLNLICDATIEYELHGLYPSDSDTAIYTRDPWCLRGGYDRVSDIDLLTVGGSTTDQRYITDGATWQDTLQEEFRKTGTRISIANAGVDGQSTYGHLMSFEHWLPEIDSLRPSWILFYVGVNDMFKSAGYAFDRLFDDSLQRSSPVEKVKKSIRKRSALFYLYRTARGAVQAHAYGLDHRYTDPFATDGWVEEPLISDHEKVLRPSWEPTPNACACSANVPETWVRRPSSSLSLHASSSWRVTGSAALRRTSRSVTSDSTESTITTSSGFSTRRLSRSPENAVRWGSIWQAS